MKSDRQISADLPYLRRYARCLVGEQARGDAYVRATLQALVDGDLELNAANAPRVALYAAFHQIWDRTGATLEQPPAGSEASDRTLQKLSPPDRKAFLLTAMEGFTLDEAAEVLAMPPVDVARDIARPTGISIPHSRPGC